MDTTIHGGGAVSFREGAPIPSVVSEPIPEQMPAPTFPPYVGNYEEWR